MKNNKEWNEDAYLLFKQRARALAEQNHTNFTELSTCTFYGWCYFAACTAIFLGSLIWAYSGGNLWLAAPLAGLAMAPHWQFMAHEGCHGALTSNKKIDRYCALYGATAMSFSEFVEEHKQHHLHTNDLHKDQDFYQLAEVFRLTDQGQIQAWHKHQHLVYYLLWPVWVLIVMISRFPACFIYLLTTNTRTRAERTFEFFVWTTSIFVLNILPFIVFGLSAEAFWLAITPRLVQWYVIINLFQPSHYHNSQSQPTQAYGIDSGSNDDPFTRCLKTTNNLSERNPLTRYLMIGTQIQHHLLPGVSASRNHQFIDLTRELAQERGLNYSHFDGYKTYLKHNIAFFKKMGNAR